jgi:dolichol kinase
MPDDMNDDDALTALVERTAGPQPWRKAFHATNAVLIGAAIALLNPSWGMGVAALSLIFLLALAADVARMTSPRANEFFFWAFAKLASPREARGVASSTWYMAGILAVFALFPRDVAISAILVLGLCDPAAAVVGRRFGTRRFLGGTLEGSLAFFAVGALTLGLRHSWPAALAAAAAATIAERRSWPLDDNFTVPVVCAAVIQASEWIA